MKKITLFTFCILSLALHAQQLRIMTYNVRYENTHDGRSRWELRKEKLLAVIQKCKPDVLGTQEALHSQWAWLQQGLPGYGSFGVGRNDGKQQGEYAGIFFNTEKLEQLSGGHFWLSETPGVAGSKGWDAADVRMVTWCRFRAKNTGFTFFCFNTHFDHVGVKAREESAALVKKMIDSLTGADPVVFCGDLNMEDNSRAYEILTDRSTKPVLTDAGKQAGDREGTFAKDFKVKKKLDKRIDYVFFFGSFTLRAYQVISDHERCRYPSDHKPVVADLFLVGGLK